MPISFLCFTGPEKLVWYPPRLCSPAPPEWLEKVNHRSRTFDDLESEAYYVCWEIRRRYRRFNGVDEEDVSSHIPPPSPTDVVGTFPRG